MLYWYIVSPQNLSGALFVWGNLDVPDHVPVSFRWRSRPGYECTLILVSY